MMKDNIVFALDIGTRSIVGIVAEKNEDTIKVIASKSIFHAQRAMVDGQIEDIKKVSRVIQEVKDSLEQSLDMKFNDVYIAAAGRSLKTEKITYEKIIDSKKPIDSNTKNVIEMEALQKAHEKFYENEKNKGAFYCVGYSVLGYKLDDNSIVNIEGHRADKISIEIIAAFLPHIVVEGLYACMDETKLNVKSLTLEPIAAMNLVIPSDLRLLNLALVDIGAGTSDIAVSKNGSIIGYEMATIAGDEITESLMKNYLVDFNTAEKIKVDLDNENENISFNNILGMENTISKNDIITSLEKATVSLCNEIASKIISLNNEPPVAVFLIGGGSKTANIKKYLSELLNLPENRIAIGTQQIIKNVDTAVIQNFGPELITPVGIAYSSILNNNYDFFSVIVNGEKVRLYSIRQMKVMDALLMAGFDSRKLMGFSGKSLNFTLNNKNYHYNGEYSTPAQIFVNSNVANIETKISPGDVIEVIPAIDGSSPIVKISDIVEKAPSGKIIFNNTEVTIGTKYMVNNVEVEFDYVIGNSDKIEIICIDTLSDLINLLEIDPKYYIFAKNDSKLDLNYQLKNGDNIVVKEKTEANVDIKAEKNDNIKEDESTVNGNNRSCSISVNLNGNTIELPLRENNVPYIFADLIPFTNIDPSKPQGKIVILHNDEQASYTNIINDGDTAIIQWQDYLDKMR